jgi:hypothetical protein
LSILLHSTGQCETRAIAGRKKPVKTDWRKKHPRSGSGTRVRGRRNSLGGAGGRNRRFDLCPRPANCSSRGANRPPSGGGSVPVGKGEGVPRSYRFGVDAAAFSTAAKPLFFPGGSPGPLVPAPTCLLQVQGWHKNLMQGSCRIRTFLWHRLKPFAAWGFL